MRGIKAKEIRRKVYGENSLRIKREYVGGRYNVLHRSGGPAQIMNHPDSLRAKYQLAKKRA